jgi:hypothetical protein
MPRRLWTEDEVKCARNMRAAGYPYNKIDEALGRRAGATQQRLEIVGYSSGQSVWSNPISDSLLAEREALAAARNQCTFTQDLFGDPPPGYSALHGKTGLR